MKGKRILAIAAGAALVLCMAGCGGGGSDGGSTYDTSRDDALVEMASAKEVRCTKDGNDLILTAEVRTPYYGDLMEKYHNEAEEGASNWEDYERRLYEMVLKDAKENTRYKTVEVEVNLSDIDPGKTEWSEEELQAAAEQAAFDEEAIEFAMEAVMEGAPSLEEAMKR